MKINTFIPGMRVRITGTTYAEHAAVIGQTGTVRKTVERGNLVWVELDNPEVFPNALRGCFGAFTEHLELLPRLRNHSPELSAATSTVSLAELT